ncbi:hypothetical protein SD960_01685 [Flavobacterium sp. MMLR14_040]|uniref:hypothetical protein n=1 Tax=Flavobacterium sp. MMLR14_040 TaxID=3093843 RepID=UPI00298F97FA|nr:hypothetical protein [Flavobacterium sp. MMLR14_040]MDW8848787.1 hypothetical protein [Flavobacterium sp. MMLR14_040]
MKSKIIKLRNFLNRNKIFFEILAAIALTSTSIFVSIKANNISESQTRIMELENTPRIEIQRTQLYDDSTKTNYTTKWIVFNNNSKISNFEIQKEISYLNIRKKNGKEIDIPLVEYLNHLGNLTGQSEGLIYEFDNKYCSEDEFLTRKEISDYGDIDVKSFIEISYNNVLGKKEIIHFQISPLIQEISEDSWEATNKDWSDKNSNAIYLKDIEKNIQKIKKRI